MQSREQTISSIMKVLSMADISDFKSQMKPFLLDSIYTKWYKKLNVEKHLVLLKNTKKLRHKMAS